jgi:glycosyltransferase involved in cell wall biosynthesis
MSAAQPKPIDPCPRADQVRVSLLPTLPVHAGISMTLYTLDLFASLQRIPEVAAEVRWPGFGAASAAGGKFESRWVRYVKYARWCRTLPGDLYHITDHSNAQLLLTLPGERTVVTCHDLYPVGIALGRIRFPGAESRLSMAPTALRLALLRRAAAVVAISQHTLHACREYLGIRASRVFLASYGVSEMFYAKGDRSAHEQFRRQANIQPGQFAILHVGSNDPRKNLGTVFEVVAALREQHNLEACLVKVGPQFGPREFDWIHRLRLTEAVRELGPLSTDETARAYAGCDLLLYPSYDEGFCRPVAEAMAAGVPVVAALCGAIPEVAKDSALLFEPDDAEGMARGILRIAESRDLRAELVERGKQAARKFTWDAHAAVVAEAYRAVWRRWV